MSSGAWGVLIPVVAIAGGITIPVTAIIMDFRRRKLVSEERRAMIEKGLVPPPMDESEYRWENRRDPAERRARSLRTGIVLLSLGIGLAVAFYLLQYVITDFILPNKLTGFLAIGAAIVGFLGIGNLIYYAISPKAE